MIFFINVLYFLFFSGSGNAFPARERLTSWSRQLTVPQTEKHCPMHVTLAAMASAERLNGSGMVEESSAKLKAQVPIESQLCNCHSMIQV